ncbi:hypothetical protein B5X24_HaOG205508 [Helicoverpa armigera]|nr:hypothetical protein B5X24_HaOG205508 [Helicoverpa armigera]
MRSSYEGRRLSFNVCCGISFVEMWKPFVLEIPKTSLTLILSNEMEFQDCNRGCSDEHCNKTTSNRVLVT